MKDATRFLCNGEFNEATMMGMLTLDQIEYIVMHAINCVFRGESFSPSYIEHHLRARMLQEDIDYLKEVARGRKSEEV